MIFRSLIHASTKCWTTLLQTDGDAYLVDGRARQAVPEIATMLAREIRL
jgi:hypothetical protein